jgi:Icc-related predicted phosphoesterase
MRVAAIYDIHGNLPALEAVLQDIRQAKVERIVVGGDVLPGPMPRETIGRLLDLDVQLRRTAYDFAKAAERIRETTYPQAQDFAARNILRPISAGEMLEAFARVELK